MKVNVKQALVDYEGKPITEKKVEDSKVVDKPVTLREVLDTSLNSVLQNETLPAEDKARRFQLSQKIYANNEVDLTVNERSFLMELVYKIYNSPMICGRTNEILEGEKPNLPDLSESKEEKSIASSNAKDEKQS